MFLSAGSSNLSWLVLFSLLQVHSHAFVTTPPALRIVNSEVVLLLPPPLHPVATKKCSTFRRCQISLHMVDPISMKLLQGFIAVMTSASVYTYQNPDTSDKIRDAFEQFSNSTVKAPANSAAKSAANSAVGSESSPPVPSQVDVAAPSLNLVVEEEVTEETPASPSSVTQEVTIDRAALMKQVANTKGKTEAALQLAEERRSSATAFSPVPAPVPVPAPAESTSATTAFSTEKPKKRFVVRLVKKVVMPWRKWKNL